jgi:hypothetical protein
MHTLQMASLTPEAPSSSSSSAASSSSSRVTQIARSPGGAAAGQHVLAAGYSDGTVSVVDSQQEDVGLRWRLACLTQQLQEFTRDTDAAARRSDAQPT